MAPRALDALLTAVLDGSTDAALVLGPSFAVLQHNRAFLSLAGMSVRDARAGLPAGACHTLLGLDACDEGCIAERAIRARRSIRVDEVASKRGDLRLIVVATPFFDDAGEPLFVLEVFRNVTAESRMQESYRRLLERERAAKELLQEEVKRRTAELERSLAELEAARGRLVQTEKMSSLGRLVAGAAHELNNPINFIYANVDFVRDYVERLLAFAAAARREARGTALAETLEAEARSFDIATIEGDASKLLLAMDHGAERVVRIVQSLKSLSIAGASRAGPCDLGSEIDLALDLLEHKASGRVRLLRDLGPLARVTCDATQIAQVVTNLVDNAFDALEGGGTVTVRTRAGEGSVVIEVNDDGCGIPEAVKPRIFEPFFTTKEPGKGTGLGLYLTYQIVEAHRGTIDVTCGVNGGTTFRVELPLT